MSNENENNANNGNANNGNHSEWKDHASIVISTPMPSRADFGHLDAFAGWFYSMMDLQQPNGHRGRTVTCFGKPIDEARNEVVLKAQALGAKYLFFVDWDVVIPRDGLIKLVWLADNNPDCDIISGLYTTKQDPSTPLIWTEWDRGVNWDWTYCDVVECVGVPAGCLLVRMSLFDKLEHTPEKPWFKLSLNEEGLETEDLWFCKRAVREAGTRILCDTSVSCLHIDYNTGQAFGLSRDSLPVRKHAERLAAINANNEKKEPIPAN